MPGTTDFILLSYPVANLYFEHAQYSQALEHFDFVRQHDGEKIEAFLGTGGSAQKLGNFELAHQMYTRVLAQFPDHHVALINMGSLKQVSINVIL